MNELIKETTDAFIDGLPDELLPLFAKVRVVSGTGLMPEGKVAAAAYGVPMLSSFMGLTCSDAPSLCNNTPKPLPESVNLIYTNLIQDPERMPNAMDWFYRSGVVRSLCNIADAHVTHDSAILKSRMDANGKIKLNRFSQSADYSYTINQELKAYFDNLRKTESERSVIDAARLMLGLDDTTDSAMTSMAGYMGPTEDFIDTCHSYLMMKTLRATPAVIILDAKTGKVHKSRKNDAAVKAKLEKMLPIIWADPTMALSDLAKLPAAGEWNQNEIDRVLVRFQFSAE
ncbi:MAG TPA: hypothetical protein VE954_21380 [Oligoflexus sp.]|uniref:hypothetical protein n=1 Tax=Oligoflexus sp. TaxID=1971216 RepID=UPI002D37B3EB|nr:hypothetical protein [Oligoflexus sp.]HYX35658.1 hypothetical protein [Oligoflexus sp.]